MKIVYALAWRTLLVFGVPFFTSVQHAHAGLYVDAAKAYADELIIAACLVCLMLGTLLGAYFPDDEGIKPLAKPVKALSSLFLGVIAFLYVLHVDQKLTIINALWVGGVAFVAPAMIGLSRQWIITSIKSKTGLDGGNAS